MTTTNQTDEIRAVLVQGDSGGAYKCHVCDSRFSAKVLAQVPDGAGRYAGFTICHRCINSDAADFMLDERADALTHQAKALRELIGRLKLPAYAELERAEYLREAARIVTGRDVPLAELLELPAESQDKLTKATRKLLALRNLLVKHLDDPFDGQDIPF